MKTIPTRFLPGVAAVVVALSASLAAVTVVDAQTPPGPPPGRPTMDGRDEHGMRMMRELDRLKTSLQLNAQQAALWDRAAAAMKPREDMRAQRRAAHDRLAAMLDDPNFDPRRMAAEMDRMGTERRARMASLRENWFAVYDSLNPSQRGQVREFLRERMEHRRHGMHGRMGGWHRGRDGADGPMTAPPPR